MKFYWKWAEYLNRGILFQVFCTNRRYDKGQRLQERCLFFLRVVKNMNLGVGHMWPVCTSSVWSLGRLVHLFKLRFPVIRIQLIVLFGGSSEPILQCLWHGVLSVGYQCHSPFVFRKYPFSWSAEACSSAFLDFSGLPWFFSSWASLTQRIFQSLHSHQLLGQDISVLFLSPLERIT